jgi:Cu/Zn superoxide dismutase
LLLDLSQREKRFLALETRKEGISMFARNFTERKIFVLAAPLLFALILAGCGGKSATNTTASVNNGLSQHATASPSVSAGATKATATLKRQPVGNANLSWDPTDHMLTAQLMLTGLAPSSVHPVHIDEGSCSSRSSSTPSSGNGTSTATKALYPLVNATADSHGVINTSSKVSVPTGIPAKSWYLEVYNGPGLSAADQAMPIACGDIVNHDTSLRSSQSAQVPLQAPANAANQDAQGTAHLSLSGHTLTVQLTVTGLAPKTQHMVHIHSGKCASQGSVVYPLTTLSADASGKATSTTTIQNVTSIPATGWYVNVHNGTDLSTQTGFDPITCGDVTPSNS